MKRILVAFALLLCAAQAMAAGSMQFITRTTLVCTSSTAAAFSASTTAKAVQGKTWPGTFTILHSSIGQLPYFYDFGAKQAWDGPGNPGQNVVGTDGKGMDRVSTGTVMYFQGNGQAVTMSLTVLGE